MRAFLKEHWLAIVIAVVLLFSLGMGARAVILDERKVRKEIDFKLSCLEDHYFPVQIEEGGPVVCYDKTRKVMRTHE